jgi:hypothetical protein
MHVRLHASETYVDFGSDIDVFERQCLVWYNPGSFETLEDELLRSQKADGPTYFEVQQFKAILEYLEFWLPGNFRLMELPQVQRRPSNN